MRKKKTVVSEISPKFHNFTPIIPKGKEEEAPIVPKSKDLSEFCSFLSKLLANGPVDIGTIPTLYKQAFGKPFVFFVSSLQPNNKLGQILRLAPSSLQ